MSDSTRRRNSSEVEYDSDEFVPKVYLCEVTGRQSTVLGTCSIHLGDACLAAYFHHRAAVTATGQPTPTEES